MSANRRLILEIGAVLKSMGRLVSFSLCEMGLDFQHRSRCTPHPAFRDSFRDCRKSPNVAIFENSRNVKSTTYVSEKPFLNFFDSLSCSRDFLKSFFHTPVSFTDGWACSLVKILWKSFHFMNALCVLTRPAKHLFLCFAADQLTILAMVQIRYKRPDEIRALHGHKVWSSLCLADNNHNYSEELFLIISRRKRVWHIDCLIHRLTNTPSWQDKIGSPWFWLIGPWGSGRSLGNEGCLEYVAYEFYCVTQREIPDNRVLAERRKNQWE